MFRVSFFVDDRKLGDTLRMLAGVAKGSPEVLPVVNADVGKGGKLVAQTNGGSADLFRQYIKSHNFSIVNANQAKDFLKSVGRGPGSSNYVLRQAVKHGHLKRVAGTKGTKSAYRVVK
jgi:hypothetical protein